MLRLRVFGGVAIERDGVPVTETAELHKALALLALVAASGERGVSRDQLAAFLWPESDSEHARSALSQTLYTLRKQLAEPEIFVGTRTVRLNPTAIGSDLRDFEQALARRDPEAACGFYTGPFLHGFFVSGSAEFERWVDTQRSDFAQRWAAAAESVARGATQRGDPAAAVQWWRRLTATEPGNSRAAAGLVEALAATGDRAGALRAALVHQEFLRSEFDAPPDPAVSALAEQVRQSGGTVEVATGRDAPSRSDAEPGVPRQPNAPLVGRRAVMASARVVRVATLLVLVIVLALWRLTATRGVRTGESHSVGVLDFDNLSPDSAYAFLADGLTDEIISRLGKAPSLQVKHVDRREVSRWRDSIADFLPALGRALGVQSLVYGTVRKGSDRVRVTVQMINTSNGFRIWGEQYDRAPGDILAVETEVADSAATGIARHISPSAGILLPPPPKVNAQAYDHLVVGNSYLALRTTQGDTRAIREYRAAVRLDPRFARAYGKMAFAYGICSQNEAKCFGLGRDSLIAHGFAAADSALKIDSMTSDAWLALAILRAEYDPRNLEGAPEAIDRAVALDPTNAEAHHLKAFIYRYWSDSIALAEYHKALEIEPLRAASLLQLAHTNYLLGRYRSSLTLIDSMIKVALHPAPLHFLLRGDLRRRLGDTAGARSDAETILRGDTMPGNLRMARLGLGRLQSRDDGGLEYRRLVDKMAHDFSARTGNLNPGVVSLAIDLLALGENERAIEFLERVEPSAAFWYSLKGDGLDPIRSEPRFQELCRRTRPRRANGGCG